MWKVDTLICVYPLLSKSHSFPSYVFLCSYLHSCKWPFFTCGCFSSAFETVKWYGKWNVIDVPMWIFRWEFSGWLSHQFAHWFNFMQTLSKGAFIVRSDLNFHIPTYSSMDYVWRKLQGCSAYVKTVNAHLPPSLRLGFPRLHVAIPNQNIALHFWYPANTLKGKVTVCLDFHFEMKNTMPGLSVCSWSEYSCLKSIHVPAW